jgi:hypothetical protein
LFARKKNQEGTTVLREKQGREGAQFVLGLLVVA